MVCSDLIDVQITVLRRLNAAGIASHSAGTGPAGPLGELRVRKTLAGAVLVTAGLEPKTRFEILDNELEDLEIHAVQGLEKVRAMRRALAREARTHGAKIAFPAATICAFS